MDKKNIIIGILAIAVIAIFYKWYQSRELVQETVTKYHLCRDQSDSLTNVFLYMDSASGGSTTTIIALDKANSKPIPNAKVTVQRVNTDGTLVNVENGVTNADGKYVIATNNVIGGSIKYRVTVQNGLFDTQWGEYQSRSVIASITFALKNS